MEQSYSLTERNEFEKFSKVSHETLRKLDRYAELLTEWNQKFNLVAASTIPHIWSRHFLDSAQLIRHIPKTSRTLADLGSGAGFPGLVLAIMGIPTRVHLIESTGKKANFLRTVIEELGLKATVEQMRVEGIQNRTFNVLTARALAPLPELLKLSKPLIRKDSICLFLKGQSVDTELTESKKCWTFGVEKIPSLSNSSGSVIIIRDLKAKNAATHKKRR